MRVKHSTVCLFSPAFEGLYAIAALKQLIKPIWQIIDLLVVPTTGTAYRIAEVAADPFTLSTNLGYYTNFVNLLDLAALAIPNGFQTTGVPAGITLIAPPYTESYLIGIGSYFRNHCINQLESVNEPTPHMC
jgi:allophanate hydrolase